VIEAVPKSIDLKRKIFGKLGSLCAAARLLATNTSSLPITIIADACARRSVSLACTSSTRCTS